MPPFSRANWPYPMKILVTGGAGFIGSHVVRSLLQAGSGVAILDDFNDLLDPRIKRANVKEFNGEAEVIEADIRDASAMKEVVGRGGYDSIIHIAARAACVRQCETLPPTLKPTWLAPTTFSRPHALRGLASFFLPLVPRSMVWRGRYLFGGSGASSDVESVCRHETCRRAPLRKLLPPLRYAGRGNEVFTVYGPAHRPDLAIYKFTDCIYHGRPIQQYGDGTTRRDYTYVDDIVQGVWSLKYRRTPFEIFNLGENQTTTLTDLIGSIEERSRQKGHHRTSAGAARRHAAHVCGH